MSEWQPIETAKRDANGETVLAWGKFRADPVTVIWDSGMGKWRSNVYPYLDFDEGQFTRWQPTSPPSQ